MRHAAYRDLERQVWAEFAAAMVLPPTWTPQLNMFLESLREQCKSCSCCEELPKTLYIEVL